MKRSFVIAHFWDANRNSIACYTYGSQVQYGTEEDANDFLNYVKEKSPEHNWEVFWIPTDRDEMVEPPEMLFKN